MKFDLLIFPLHDWKKCLKEGFRTRDAHLIQEFEKNPAVRNILIVDRPVSPLEMAVKRYWWLVRDGRLIYKKGCTALTRISEKIHVLDMLSFEFLKPLVMKKQWWSYKYLHRNTVEEIKNALKELSFDNTVLFIWHPSLAGQIGKYNEKITVFDALDNWTKHPEVRDGVSDNERGYDMLKEKADIIFTNSVALKDFMTGAKSQVYCIPNGVSPDVFKENSNNDVPGDMKYIKKPVIGYAGKLAQRIDIELIKYLAEKMKEASFVLVGPVLNKSWVYSLYRLKNVYLLGDKHYTLLPQYLNAFDICTIPHNTGELENDGDPIKLYEYLAAGKPVVTTDIAGVDEFKDVITIARNREEFYEGLKRILKSLHEQSVIPQKLRDRVTKRYFWSTKAEFMITKIEEKLSEKGV